MKCTKMWCTSKSKLVVSDWKSYFLKWMLNLILSKVRDNVRRPNSGFSEKTIKHSVVITVWGDGKSGIILYNGNVNSKE